jgi:hypothetical protein
MSTSATLDPQIISSVSRYSPNHQAHDHDYGDHQSCILCFPDHGHHRKNDQYDNYQGPLEPKPTRLLLARSFIHFSLPASELLKHPWTIPL